MKFISGIFIAALFVPAVSFGQVRVTMTQVQEVILLSKHGETDKAIARIESLRRSVTVRDSVYLTLIGISEEINAKAYNIEGAIKDAEEIMKLRPDLEAYAQGNIGQYKAIMGDFDGAIAAYTRALALDKTKRNLYTSMANVYNHAGRYRDAINILSMPDAFRHPQEDYHYAVAYFNLNKADSAKLYIDKYLESGSHLPNEFEPYLIGAQIYARRGDKKKSCELITTSNDIITKAKVGEQLQKAPARMKEYYYVKDMLKEIAQAQDLKTKLCE